MSRVGSSAVMVYTHRDTLQDQMMGNLEELEREMIQILTKASYHPRSKNSITINAFAIKTTDRINIPFICKYIKTAIHSFPRHITRTP